MLTEKSRLDKELIAARVSAIANAVTAVVAANNKRVGYCKQFKMPAPFHDDYAISRQKRLVGVRSVASAGFR